MRMNIQSWDAQRHAESSGRPDLESGRGERHLASGCRPSHEGRLAGLHTSRSNLHCVAKASECAVAREKWRMATQNIEGILMLGNPVRRRRARAPKGNRLRAAGARGEPILTSKAIRRSAEAPKMPPNVRPGRGSVRIVREVAEPSLNFA